MFLSIGVDECQDTCQIFQQSSNVTYPVLADEDLVVTPQYLFDWGGGAGIFIVPHNCMVDDEQILRYSEEGYILGVTYLEMIEFIEDSLLNPELGSTTTEIEFTGVEVGETAEFDIYLDNIRTGIVNVTSASVSGEPYSVIFSPGEIYAVDDSMLVMVVFSPTEPGQFSDVLTVSSDANELQIPINAFVGIADRPDDGIPEDFALYGNYPNPFNSKTTIEFALPAATEVTIEVFDINGTSVASINGGLMAQGTHYIGFDASELPTGLYFYRLTAGNYSAVGKMILLK
ncbi:MAG: T9SS type A sorting domain-containing protein [FCB group bacterium]|nr:T9SS type A sorting domain-containing protein [FCB group bacterium]